ncbi:MAG TPA: cobyric acid synthase [Thermodesulfobacteriaceae bacterium]|nr:cobyric acid synthase [Thermodesulfobacteriaceae bacterium]
MKLAWLRDSCLNRYEYRIISCFMSGQAKSIMFQGTGSGVGKSIIAAALCRVLFRMGVRVAPFKAQNMALNSFVTADGREMGRAQVYQAEACGLDPDVRMNPILLKPTGDSRSQVIVMGRPVDHFSARDYYACHRQHTETVRRAYDSLAADFEAIVIEGAGSPAEINLQATDIVNMNMASHARSPVIVVGDIDRGGVFAWLKGTWDLVPDRHRHLIRGFIINKFRGDVSLLQPGVEQFARMVPVPVLGVMPWFEGIEVDQEDGCFVRSSGAAVCEEDAVRICVVHLPRISNFTDFAPLGFEHDVDLAFCRSPDQAGRCSCIIIPGTKATRRDLEWMHRSGWTGYLTEAAARGVMIAGICGGYQMLGLEVKDPDGIEGPPGTSPGLGLLPVSTVMAGRKELSQVRAEVLMPPMIPGTVQINGYEIHMGRTSAEGKFMPIGPGLDEGTGAAVHDLSAWGTYIHGIFACDGFRRDFLDFLRIQSGMKPVERSRSWRKYRDEQIDSLAAWMEQSVDMGAITALMGL